MLRVMVKLIICIFAVQATNLFAQSQISVAPTVDTKPTLVWLVEDKEENKDLLAKTSPSTSVATYIENQVIGQLSAYHIEIKRVTMKRIDQILKNSPNACAANRAKLTSRQAYSYFSKPQAFYLTHKLFRYHQSDALPQNLFNDNGEIIAIENVFEHAPDKIIGIAEGVSFGPFLDQAIERIAPDNIYYRRGINRVTALETMLYLGRIDYLLALPIDMKPTAQQKAQLEQYAIAGAPPYLIAYFSCSKTRFGAEVIKHIDDILTQAYQTEDYYLAHKKWFSAQDLQQLQIFLQQSFNQQTFLKN